MSKIGRNDSCPCGSGKKYKKCCLGNVLDFPEKYRPREEDNGKQESENKGFLKDSPSLLDSIMEGTKGRSFESLEELNDYLKESSQEQNNQSRDNFLGLSSSQMHHLLYRTFEENQDLVALRPDKLREEMGKPVSSIPVLDESWCFLQTIQSTGKIKATQTGNLPRNLVHEFYEKFYRTSADLPRRPSSENDCYPLHFLRILLTMSGMVHKRLGYFLLTEKAKKILKTGDFSKLYQELFLSFAGKLNWGYGDGYGPQMDIIQRSLIFNLLILREKAGDWVSGEELGKLYDKAFPELKKQIQVTYTTPERYIQNVLDLRFLKRFCLFLGLLEEKHDGAKYFDRKYFYKITPLFERVLEFKITGDR